MENQETRIVLDPDELEHQKYLIEMQLCMKNPHQYIRGWMEDNLLHVGSQAWEIIALLPVSLMLPDMTFNSTHIKSAFNVLLLAPPSAGKSTIARKFEEVALNPYPVRKVSAYQLALDLSRMKIFSLILEDFSQIGNDYDVVKVIEGAVGDERTISLHNKNIHIQEKVRGCGILEGTWTDLGRYLEYFKSGLLFRYNLVFIDLTEQQKMEIGRYINEGIGNKDKSEKTMIKEKVVKAYYERLKKIMAGEDKEIPQVTDYHLEKKFKDEIYKLWQRATDKYSNLEYNFNREMHEAYRISISSALLNIFHRKVTPEGILYPNDEDFALGKKLMVKNINNKVAILRCKALVKSSTAEQIKEALADEKIPSTTKRILENLYGFGRKK